MPDVVAFVGRDKKVWGIRLERTIMPWPNSQGIKPRSLRKHFRFWWRIGAFRDDLHLKFVRQQEPNRPQETYDVIDELGGFGNG